jgi:hypothetical protein
MFQELFVNSVAPRSLTSLSVNFGVGIVLSFVSPTVEPRRSFPKRGVIFLDQSKLPSV